MSDQVIFGAVARDYAALGLRVIPTGGEDGKTPRIRNWQRVGRGAVEQLAAKFPYANIGLIDGDRGGITRADVDDPALEDSVIERFGDTPVVVSTPSGGAHFYYRANGERRIIGLDGEKVDVLGRGGLRIAPPSIHPTKGPYRFRKGGLVDFERLPTIRSGSLLAEAYVQPKSTASSTDRGIADREDRIEDGTRNKWLFRRALQLAPTCDWLDELIDLLRAENEICDPPLSPLRVITTARSAWKYEQEGKNWVGQEPRAQLFQSEFHRLHQHPDAIGLLLELRLGHACRNGDFVLANALAEKFGWGLNRFRKARTILVEKGFLIPTHGGGKGPHDPPCYRFGR